MVRLPAWTAGRWIDCLLGWLAEAGFREAVEFSEFHCQKSIRSVRQRAEHLCAESGVNFSEQFNGIDVIVDVIAVGSFRKQLK